jgi:hypothetical protein
MGDEGRRRAFGLLEELSPRAAFALGERDDRVSVGMTPGGRAELGPDRGPPQGLVRRAGDVGG